MGQNLVEDEVYVMLMMMRADESYSPSTVEGCTAEELLKCITADDYDACIAACSGNEGEEPTGNGFVTVKGKAEATQEVAKNAVNKKVGTITLKAGEYDTTVSSVVIGHSGLGDATAVSVQLFQNGVGVTSQKDISKSSQQVTLKLSPAVVMKANSSMTFDVVASLSGETNETHNFSVEAVNVANGKAEGTPVSLGTLKTTSYTAGHITVTSMTPGSTLRAGDTNKTLVTVNLNPSKKGVINGITITKDAGYEDLDSLVSNVKAYYNDEVIGTVKVTDEKIVVSNLSLEKNAGQSVSIELRGDCIFVGSGVTTKLVVEKNDVLAVEANTDENMGNAAYTTGANLVVNGADLKITNKTTKEQTVVPGTSDVELLNVEITSKSELEVTDYTITLTQGADTFSGNFVDGIITVYVDGEDYEMDATTFTGTRKQSFTVEPNRTVKVRAVANFVENATGATYKMTLSLNKAKTTEGNNEITLGKTQAGHSTKLQVATATIKAATKSAPVTSSLFANKDQEVFRFAIKAASDKTTIKSLTLGFTGDSINVNTGDDLKTLLDGNLKLVNIETDEVVDDATFDFESFVSSGIVTVKDMNLDVEKDTTANFKLMADLGDIEPVMDKKVKVSLTAGTFKTSTTNVTGATISTAVEGKEYTFRATAPDILLAKASDNMFEVTIKNLNDTGIVYSGLTYRVRTDVANSDFSGNVCLVSDVNVITCGDTGTGVVLSSGTLAQVIVDTTTGTLAENDEVTYYILVDGVNIEPDVLRAEISSLSYGTTNALPERYNISMLLNGNK